jgi:hypothetical protein
MWPPLEGKRPAVPMDMLQVDWCQDFSIKQRFECSSRPRAPEVGRGLSARQRNAIRLSPVGRSVAVDTATAGPVPSNAASGQFPSARRSDRGSPVAFHKRVYRGTNLTEYEILRSCMHVSELRLKDHPVGALFLGFRQELSEPLCEDSVPLHVTTLVVGTTVESVERQ